MNFNRFPRLINSIDTLPTMSRLSQACLLGYLPAPQHAFQGEATDQTRRLIWLSPKDSPGPWDTWRDSLPFLALRPCLHTVITAHTWISLPRATWGSLITRHQRGSSTADTCSTGCSLGQCGWQAGGKVMVTRRGKLAQVGF